MSSATPVRVPYLYKVIFVFGVVFTFFSFSGSSLDLGHFDFTGCLKFLGPLLGFLIQGTPLMGMGLHFSRAYFYVFQSNLNIFGFCQTPNLVLGLGVDFTFPYNNNNKNKNKNNKNPHLISHRREGTRGSKFGTQT